MVKKTSISERLNAARTDLADVEAKIGDIGRQRNEALLSDKDVDAARLGDQLARLQRNVTVLTDKIRLLVEQEQQEKHAAAAQRRQQIVDEFRRKLEQADAVGKQMQDTCAQLEKEFRQVIALREEARASWPVGGNSHINSVADTAEGCALSPSAVRVLLAYELFRISHKPFLGGKTGARGEVSLPGSACPDLRLQGLPEKITPLAEALSKASAYACEVMQSIENPAPPEITVPPEIVASPEISSPLVTSPPATPPTPPTDPRGVNLRNVTVPTGTSRSGRTWSQLTAEQMRLANGPQNEQTEQAYQAVIAELAEITKEQAA